MGVLFEAVEVIQQRVEEGSHRPWLEEVEEVREELKRNRILESKRV